MDSVSVDTVSVTALHTTHSMSLYAAPKALQPRVKPEACQCLFGTEDLCKACVRSRFAGLRSEIEALIGIIGDHTSELWDEVMAMRTRISQLEAELVHQKALSCELQTEIFRLQVDFYGGDGQHENR